MRQKRALRWQHTASYVRVAVDGNPTIEEFRPLLREIAADAVSWERPALLLDLRSLCKEWSLAEQFLFGGLMSRKLSQLKMVAVLQVAGQRLSAAGRRQANRDGANVSAFDDESEALDWLLGMGSPVAPAC
jgi:hypothetical protein